MVQLYLRNAEKPRHDANTPDLGTGPEGYKRLVALSTTEFPDLQNKLNDTIPKAIRL